jgi:DNA polymerase I
MSKPTLLLVDGSSYLYRAFHALPDLRNPQGDPTGAIYGMVAMLRRLREDIKWHQGATHGAVVFDAKGKTFRDEWYPQYKANRSSMPEDLVRQIEPIHALTRLLGWPLLMIEGIEADDVIGTLAVQARAAGMLTRISTGDKDLAQLVNPDVLLFNTMVRDGAPAEPLDEAGVKAKFGVAPDRIVDFLTLTGDTVDNVPGVDKVGPKTAAKWIEHYGSLDNLLAQAQEVKGAVGENLRAKLDWLPLGRKLVTVKTDVDLTGQVPNLDADLRLQAEDLEGLAQFFERYGMRSFLRSTREKLQGHLLATHPAEPAPSTASEQAEVLDSIAIPLAAPVQYECILSISALDRWMDTIQQAELTAVDTETTSLDHLTAQIVGISLSVEAGKACYIPLAHTYAGAPDQLSREQVLERLRPWLESSSQRKVGQNLKYDQHVFANHGIALRGIAHDTLLQSYVIEAHKSHDMGSLATRHLNRSTIAYADVAGKGASQIGFDQVSVEQATQYSSEDADVTMHLHGVLYPQVERLEKLRFIYESVELPAAQVLFRMERNGVKIDSAALAQQSHELGERLLTLEKQAYEVAEQPFNLNSPKQLGEILFEKLKLPVVKKTASGAPSTDEEVLEKLAQDYPLPQLLLQYRGLAKLKSTYTDKLPRMVNAATGRVHTNYAQAVAVTGRLSSNDPNLQNIPVRTEEGRRVREAFIAEPGHQLLSADYSQIELRIMAHISQDASLLGAFERGDDVHRATAAEIFGLESGAVTSEQRRYAKVINFGLIYGMSAFGLAGNLGITREAAKNYIERYFARYPGVARYMQETREKAKAQGFVETVFGRRLWLAEINSPNGPRRQGAERAAINAPMQGTAADLIKLAMVAVQNWLDQERLQSKLIMQVHDELIVEAPDAEVELLRVQLPRLMASVAQLRVPLIAEVGVGLNWEQAH